MGKAYEMYGKTYEIYGITHHSVLMTKDKHDTPDSALNEMFEDGYTIEKMHEDGFKLEKLLCKDVLWFESLEELEY